MLSNNNITELQEKVFSGAPLIVHLCLENNMIEKIHHDAFFNLNDLGKLQLNNNRLTKFSMECLKHNFQLSHLELNFNRITKIEDEGYKNCNLTYLSVSKNIFIQYTTSTTSDQMSTIRTICLRFVSHSLLGKIR